MDLGSSSLSFCSTTLFLASDFAEHPHAKAEAHHPKTQLSRMPPDLTKTQGGNLPQATYTDRWSDVSAEHVCQVTNVRGKQGGYQIAPETVPILIELGLIADSLWVDVRFKSWIDV